jgi:dihydrodipicolinate synthase/N-acetylneuraminate lyase
LRIAQFAGIFNVIDNSNQPVRCHRNGGRGYISTSIPAFPAHELEIWALLEAHRYDDAQAVFAKVEVPLREFMATAAQKSGGYRVGKGMMALIGHPVGPPRPPTLPLDADEMSALRELMIGFGWPVAARARRSG